MAMQIPNCSIKENYNLHNLSDKLRKFKKYFTFALPVNVHSHYLQIIVLSFSNASANTLNYMQTLIDSIPF